MIPNLVTSQALPSPVPMIEEGRMAGPFMGGTASVREHLRRPSTSSLIAKEVVVMLHARTSRRGVSPRHMGRAA